MIRSSGRGFTVVAALVFVVILGGAVVALENAADSADSIALSAATQTAAPLCVTFNGRQVCDNSTATPKAPKPSEVDAACQKAKENAAASKSQNTKQQSKTADDDVKEDCIAAVYSGTGDKKKPESYTCVGKTTTINIDDKKIITSESSPNPEIKTPGLCKTLACQMVPGEAGGAPVKKCFVANLAGIDRNKLNTAFSGGDTGVTTFTADNMEKLFDPKTDLPLPHGSNISDAFAEQQKVVEGQIDTQKKAIDTAQSQIDQIAYACGYSTLDDPACRDATKQAQEKLNTEKQRLAELQKQKEAFAAAQVAPRPPPNDPPRQCPSGYTGTYPSCTPAPGCPGCGGGGGGPDRTGFGGGNPLGSLLSGLSNAMRPTPPAPVAQPAPAAQSCSTDQKAYAQQQQQYQQQMQQYNYQLQQYQYQQQLSQYNNSYYGQSSIVPIAQPAPPAMPQPCTPSTQQQCANQPQQPPAANCSVGYWQAVYNGTCIARWDCIPTTRTATTTRS